MSNVEQIIQIATGKKKRYKRQGSCVRCGVCCINENCQHFKINDNGFATCLIHNSKYRPKKCKFFPQAPPILFKTCGYYFYDIAEDKIIKAGECP
jgi:hypothetical protein